jgi:hypothetical protein
VAGQKALFCCSEDPTFDAVRAVVAAVRGAMEPTPVLDHRFIPDGMDPGICQKCGSTKASHRDAVNGPGEQT